MVSDREIKNKEEMNQLLITVKEHPNWPNVRKVLWFEYEAIVQGFEYDEDIGQALRLLHKIMEELDGV